eukprot:214435-Pelagomonas_calceolata.AAC.7
MQQSLTLSSGHRADDLGPGADVHDVGHLHPRNSEVCALAAGLFQHSPEAIKDDRTLPTIHCSAEHVRGRNECGWVGEFVWH